MEIGFYHLTRTPVEEALPALLGRTLDAGERALVRCPDTAIVTALDKALWACREPVWLPHGTAKTGHEARQPIWLTSGEDCPNGARFLFRVNGAGSDEFSEFVRVFDLFDGSDDQAVQMARQRWVALKASGHTLVYWKQEARGWKKSG
ncbi:DNA polymerase III subunit chi [Gluconobacter wancherniae]|uniref:DNA polymerase III subunit chi n=1 Tax=Gluconobacter wancherniae NBRC 103581 TaxID=656744 RepID=A0A511B3G5_9PROT|nr:DNA polymerase III subunit chi [Gluconobacter wancherniae]MBF0853876.1 DNA polymerase III subunit chi [Gluconobacter wancherniae]GBD56931.1 DNA polymerase III subunit chi [Gluconobacter wancherniae NBRC 103581]GBR64845.1 DNA polymerase III subunit chi [Gluconobacter wancherniae NBRC 103581]GEK94302.1 DNA polymerase III subunit chi [Gluconobacter wancherniae NBRC 103581]